jgi:hypothetical protein
MILSNRPTLENILETSENEEGRSDTIRTWEAPPALSDDGAAVRPAVQRGEQSVKVALPPEGGVGGQSDIQILMSNTQTKILPIADDQGTGSGTAALSPKASEDYHREGSRYSQKTRSAADSKSVALGMRKLRFDDVFDQTRVG